MKFLRQISDQVPYIIPLSLRNKAANGNIAGNEKALCE